MSCSGWKSPRASAAPNNKPERLRATACFLLAVLLLATGCGGTPPIDRETTDEFVSFLQTRGKSPVDYVTGKFQTCDVVFLGEQHRIRHDVRLVARLIPALHKAGVHVLATEFARAQDQPLIDSLLDESRYDWQLAQRITFQQSVTWAYREYVDLYKAAWKFNQSLDSGQVPFRIVGLNCSPDWSLIQTADDRDVDSLKRLVWGGCGEADWARIILAEVERGEKVLVYCGIHHAFTKYLQPIVSGNGEFVRFEENRCGRYVFNVLGERTATIYLHAPWTGPASYADDMVPPADGTIDYLMAQRPDTGAVGFDLAGSPVANLELAHSIYHHGYEPFRLGEFCDGWIYFGPWSQYAVVTQIYGFINGSNIDYARAQHPNPQFRQASVEDMESSITRELHGWQEVLRSFADST